MDDDVREPDVAWAPLALEEKDRGGGFRRLFSGWFGRLLLPAIIAQSILIGGGYASGREVVEFGARYGAMGWIAVVAVFVGFTIMSVLVFEFARITKSYDYKSFIRGLIGPLWPAFDAAYAIMAVLVVAVVAAAAGAVIEATLGMHALMGILIVILIAGLLAYLGTHVIEAFKTLGTTALYLGYVVFGVVVLSAGWPEVVAVFERGDTGSVGTVSAWPVIGVGILYVGYNLAIYPAVLFALHRQGRTRDSVLSGVLAGLVMTLPFLLTYLCVLAFYPSESVLGADVPWLPMLESSAGMWAVIVFGIVVGWTLLETSIGLVHAILDRLERDIVPLNLPGTPRGQGLSGMQKALLGGGGLFAAALLSQVGIGDLIGTGYLIMAYVFLAVFALPLLTVGVWRILRARKVEAREGRQQVERAGQAPGHDAKSVS